MVQESRYLTRTSPQQSSSLADVLDRILDKGLVIAGDIRVDLVNVELLTIRLRLLVASVDTARAMGIDWWERDGFLRDGRSQELEHENRELRERLERLEALVAGDDVPAREDAGSQ